MGKKTRLFLIKGSPSFEGVGATIYNYMKKFLSKNSEDIIVDFYDQALENNNDVYRKANIDQFLSSDNESITPFEKNIINSEGIIVICPVYLRQVPGLFKQTLDSFSYRAHEFPLLGKKIVLFTYGTSNGADDLCKYLGMIFTSMGAEIVVSQSCFLIDGTLNEEIASFTNHISKMLTKIANNQYTVTKRQEDLFQFFKNIVLQEIKSGITTNKQKRWKELLPYNSLVEYLEEVKLDKK